MRRRFPSYSKARHPAPRATTASNPDPGSSPSPPTVCATGVAVPLFAGFPVRIARRRLPSLLRPRGAIAGARSRTGREYVPVALRRKHPCLRRSRIAHLQPRPGELAGCAPYTGNEACRTPILRTRPRTGDVFQEARAQDVRAPAYMDVRAAVLENVTGPRTRPPRSIALPGAPKAHPMGWVGRSPRGRGRRGGRRLRGRARRGGRSGCRGSRARGDAAPAGP